MKRVLLLLAGLSLFLLAAGLACRGDDSPDTRGSPTSGDVPSEPETVVAQRLGVNDSGYGHIFGALPDDFPASFPIYEDSIIQISKIQPNAFVVEFHSLDSPDDIAAFYEEALDAEPWGVVEVDELGQDATLIDFEGGGETAYTGAMVVVPFSEGLTRIIVGLRLVE